MPLVPPSRFADCKETLTDGRVRAGGHCNATDGFLSRPSTAPPSSNPPAQAASGEGVPTELGTASISLFLPVLTAIGSVSVHGCNLDCQVEVSDDGSTWALPRRVEVEPSSSEPFGLPVVIASFEPVVLGRFVRVSSPGQPISVSEISAWPPPPDQVQNPTAMASAPRVGRRPTNGRSVGPPLVAVLLLGAVGAGVVVEATRWRRALWVDQRGTTDSWANYFGGPSSGPAPSTKGR